MDCRQKQDVRNFCAHHFGAFVARRTETGRGAPECSVRHRRAPRTWTLESDMSTTEEILAQARTRAPGQPYAGAVTPQEAYALLQAEPNVKLVDVRTNAERDWVGRPAVPEAQHAAVQWSLYPGGVPNAEFAAQLAARAQRDQVLLFLCRSGVRSRHAARVATEMGYSNAFDILEGFEGDRDAEGHRKTVGGWCKAGLPWVGA
jgi:rhodanese-related sulfurtransferase